MRDLQHTLDAEIDTLSRFVSLLRQEQGALARGEIDDLASLAGSKGQIAGELSRLAAARSAQLAAQGFSTDRSGMQNWLAGKGGGDKLAKTWAQVLSLATEARELNRVNGELIQIRLQHNAQAIDTLHSASRSLNLYGPDGQTSAPSSRRINDAA